MDHRWKTSFAWRLWWYYNRLFQRTVPVNEENRPSEGMNDRQSDPRNSGIPEKPNDRPETCHPPFTEIVGRFERACLANNELDLESLLQEVAPAFRASLLEQLLTVKKQICEQDQQSFDADMFRLRFPEFEGVVDAVVNSNDGNADDDTAKLDPDRTIVPRSKGPCAADDGGAVLESWDAGSSVKYFGDYELIEEIARGGMGVVFRARQTSLNRIVALKMILSGQLAGEQEVQRFQLEAEAAANLDHPGIVPIYEVGIHGGQHYFSMGFVDGHSLADRLGEGPLPAREAAELTMKTAQAIAYAHSRGVIHRDLKPANVLIDATGEPRVTDFGLAKHVEQGSDLTATGQVIGTPSYMPPEQASGVVEQINEKADIYSLGGILYALLTGRPPFQAASTIDTLMQVIEKDPIPPRQLDANIPRDIETIALKALDKNPERRYATAQDLAEDLRRFLEHLPIEARAISRVERAWRLARRKPVVASLGGLAALLTLVILIGAPLFAVRESGLRAEAEQRKTEAEQRKTEAEIARREAQSAQSNAEQAQVIAESSQRQAEKAQAEAEYARDQLATQKENSERKLYARTLSLAYQQWHANNVYRAESLLDKTENRFRDWEWKFLKKLCRAESKTLRGHAGTPFRVRQCDDEKHLVSIGSADNDPNVYLWDLETGIVIQRYPYRGFAISKDGRYVALEKKNDGKIHIVDVLTGKSKLELGAHRGGTAWADFNSNGSQLVTTGPDSTIRIWDLDSPEVDEDGDVKPAVVVLNQMRRMVHAVNFSADDKFVFWKTVEGKIQLINASDGELIQEIVDPIYRQNANRVAMSQDNKILAAASDGPINLFDVNSGERVAAMYGHDGSVLGLDFSPDGQRLVSSGTDGTVRVWDVNSRRELCRFRGHKFGNFYGVPEVVYSMDGQTIISGGHDTTIKIWPANAGDQSPHPEQDAPAVAFMKMLPGGEAFVNENRPVSRARMFPDPSQENDWLVGHRGIINSMAFAEDESFAVTASGTEVFVHDLSTREAILEFKRHRQHVSAVAVHPDGKRVASGEYEHPSTKRGKIYIWNRETGKILHTLRGNQGHVDQLQFSRDGSKLYSTTADVSRQNFGELIVWDVESGDQLAGNSSLKCPLGFDLSRDNRQIAVAERGIRKITIYDAQTLEKIKTLGNDRVVNATQVMFSPDGKRLVANDNWIVVVYDIESGSTVWENSEHTGQVTDVTFFPGGKRIASVSVDQTTKVWDADTGNVVVELNGDAFYLHGVAVSPQGQHLASYGEAPYVTLRSLDPDLTSVGELADTDQWPIIFSDDFDRSNLGENWTSFYGSAKISDGALHQTLEAVATQRGFYAATVIPNVWLPSVVEIEYDTWAPQKLTFETKLHDEQVTNGLGAAANSNHSWLNQARDGMSIFVQASGSFRETANVVKRDWFSPGKKYHVRVLRNRGSLRLYVDGAAVLESNVPESLWVPVLHLQGSFGKPGEEYFLDNLVIRAPAELHVEMEAAKLEQQVRDKLILKAFVIHALQANTDADEEVKQLAIRYAKLRSETSATRMEQLKTEVVRDRLEASQFRSLLPTLKDDLNRADKNDWDTRQLVAAVQYRAGDLEAALKLLEEVDSIYRRTEFLSNPITKSLQAMAYYRQGDQQQAKRAMEELNELMRSDYWQGKPEIVMWHERAKTVVQVAPPANPANAKDIEDIKRVTFELQQRGVIDHDLDAYFQLFTNDAVQIDGRSVTPNELDIEKPIAQWKDTIRAFRQGPPITEHYLIRGPTDVTVDGDEARLHATYYYFLPQFAWVWKSEERLRRTPDGWKVYRRRHGVTGRRHLGEEIVTTPDDWLRLDQRVEEAKERGDDRATFDALNDALRFREANTVAREIVQRSDATAIDWLKLAGTAFGLGDGEEMLRAARNAVELDPMISGLPFIRSVAVNQLIGKSTDIGHGIKVRSLPFFKPSEQPAVGVPPDVLGTWHPSETSIIAVFHGSDLAEKSKDIETVFEELKTKMTSEIFNAKILDERTFRLGDPKDNTSQQFLPGKKVRHLILNANGNGRFFGIPGDYQGPTTMRWVAIQRGDELIGFVVSAAEYEFADRNSEFEAWLKHVEIDALQ